MPATIACPSCKTKYNLPDKFLGKAIKCKSCGKAFKTRAPGAPGKSGRPGAKQRPAQPKAPSKPLPAALRNQASADELARLGIDGPLKSQPDIFGSAPARGQDPLANHVVQDPGFRARSKKQSDSDDLEFEDEGFSDLYENSAVTQQAKLKGGKDKHKLKKEDELLKSYMREDLFNDDDYDDEGPPEVGINRSTYFWSMLGVNALLNGLTYIGALASGFEADAEMAPDDFGAFPIIMMIVSFLTILIFGAAWGFFSYARTKNMGFKSELWPTIVGCVAVSPFVLLALFLILALAGAPSVGLLFFFGAGVMFLAAIPISYTNIAIPPDFVKTRRYDVWAWVWTAVWIIPFLGLFVLLIFSFIF